MFAYSIVRFMVPDHGNYGISPWYHAGVDL